MGSKFQIGVIGHSDNELVSKEILDVAEKTGEEIAKSDSVLICGGMGGIMEAAAKGANKLKGFTIGILPFNKTHNVEHNKYLNSTIRTGMDFSLRANVVVFSSDGIIALSGGSGTLNELAIAYIYEIPVVLLRRTGGWTSKVPLVMDGRNKKPFIEANTPQEAVSKLILEIKKNESKTN